MTVPVSAEDAPPASMPMASKENFRQRDEIGSEPPIRLVVGFDSREQERRVFEWLASGLRPGRPGRLAQEYPLLFQRNPSVFHTTLYSGENPAAFCTLWAVHFRIGVHRLRVGLISLVYTDPSARGRGHARRVVAHAIEKACELKLGLALLWSDVDSLYRGLGFAEAGAETLLVLDPSIVDKALEAVSGEVAEAAARSSESLRIETPSPEDWSDIERLRGDRDCQLDLDPGELLAMRSMPDMSVRIARRAREIVAFAMRGRGDDFEEVIHEWAGCAEGALRCFQSLLADCEPHSELFLLAPTNEDEISWPLRRAGARIIEKPLAWMRILSLDAFAEDLTRILGASAPLRIREVHTQRPTGPEGNEEKTPGQIELGSARGSLMTDRSTLLSLLFDRRPRYVSTRDEPQQVHRRSRPLAAVMDETALDALPLRLFVWGMESI